MEEYISITEAAKMLHVSRETVYDWIRKGKVKPIKLPSGRLRIPKDELVRPLNQQSAEEE